ncbi:MAG TPA: hypothetical protein GX514_04060 [Thermoanaerobacterales bacterium]|uniref:hypothetical protein n=1 Tax=Tepidanaerobacter sp. GT38 TaxID=2722793 RepID=UPI0017E2D4D0|nr:hypothetical protein [Tepidanaerobacter sp. GT38]MCG1012998.1 hypothetical protein [Tepidanaerobacter sp. GT38]HHY42007.1 hypothetical protein [Thermoanaerobacterales bacterium]
MELLTINKEMPHFLAFNLHEPFVLINELKKIVKDLKQKNPNLNNYRLMDVGFTANKKDISQMRLYFIKKSL